MDAKVKEFQRRAAQCRKHAAASTIPDVRQNYEELAEIWERLAAERLLFLIPGAHDAWDATPKPH